MRTEISECLFADFFEAFDAFEEYNLLEHDNKHAVSAQKENEVLDYLQKGERLVDMARTIYKRKISKISLTDAEKLIFSFQVTKGMSMYEIIQHIARAFTRPCLKNMKTCDDEYAVKLLDAVSCPGLEITLAYESDPFYDDYVRYNACGKKQLPEDDDIIRVIFKEKGYAPMCFHGAKNTVHQKKDVSYDHAYGDYRFLNIVDLGYFFAALIIYVQVIKELQRFCELDSESRANDMMYCLFKETLDKYIQTYLSRFLLKFNTEKVFSVASISEMFKYPLNIGYLDDADKELLAIMYNQRVRIDIHTSPSRKWEKQLANQEPSLGIRNMAEFGICFMMEQGYTFRYHNFIKNISSKDHYWGLPKGYVYRDSTKMQDSSCMEMFVHLFRIIAEEKHSLKQQEDYYYELETSTHAKSYQLKKSIPGKILREMENSLFNEYFGFVEFDEQTDIEKEKEIAFEFKALKDTYLQSIDASQNAIRFRKLGNHRAGGLYYPSIKCLCVDIHCPQSLVHEFGHLIDYSLGGLSSLNDFRKVKTMYIDFLYNKMYQDSTFNDAMKKKGKYNLKYYSLPTEIFARSFELYISQVLGVHNSIVPVDFSEVYPKDDVFFMAIADYFNNLLGLSADSLPQKGTKGVPDAAFVAAGR